MERGARTRSKAPSWSLHFLGSWTWDHINRSLTMLTNYPVSYHHPRSLAAQATVAATLVLSSVALSLVGLMLYVLLV